LDEPLLYECFAKALVVPGLDREVAAKFMVLTGGNPKCDLVNLKKVCMCPAQPRLGATQTMTL